MSLEDILIALRAADEGAIDRDALSRLLAIIDTWDRGGLHPSAGELLTKQFRIDASKVRRWESEITGQGQRRIGRYQLRRKVGQGGMGLVFEALDPNLGRTVALKLLSGDRLDSPVSVQRFLREAKSSGSFNHPNIVHAFDAGIDGDLPYLVMEFVDGENLYQVLKRRGRIPPREGLDWLIQGARALEVLERKRWVHGDVKPSNFIITRGGVVKLADLGLCGPPGQPRPGVSPHGTPPYIAPEVLAGEYIDHRADLYSLGATIYHLIAGRPPRTSRSIDDLRAEMAQPLVPLAAACPGVSPQLSAIVMRLLETSPERRLSGGVALLGALEELVPEPAVDPSAETATETPASIEPTPLERPRRRVWAALGLSVIAVGVAIGLLAGPGGQGKSGDGGGETVREGDSDPGVEGSAELGEGDSADETELARAEPTSWSALREAAADDYARLFAWLAGEGAAHPEVETLRAELTAELSQVVAPHWGTLSNELQALRARGRYHAALDLLEDFPAKWRAGPYAVAWEEGAMNVRGDRRAHLARLLLTLRNEAASLGALEVWQSLGNEAPADALWLRLRIESELGGLPFLSAAHEAWIELADTRARRRDEFPRALVEGRLPAPQWHPLTPESVLDEAVLTWLAQHPQVAGTAGALLPRLYEAGVLGAIDPGLLAHLLTRVGETAKAPAEVAAARCAEAALVACRAFDLDTAEHHWRELQKPAYAETLAAERAIPSVEELRRELNRAAFLRSEAFVAEVRGSWRQPTTLTWDPSHSRFEEEWRFEGARFSVEGEGRRVRGRGARQRISPIVPFTENCTITTSIEVPAEEWTLLIGRGDNVLGFSGVSASGNCRVIGGERGSVLSILARGKGAPYQIPPDPNAPGRLLLQIRYLDGRWELDGGLSFSVGPVPPPAWLWLEVPTGGWIGSFSITGEVVEPWLIARKAYFSE